MGRKNKSSISRLRGDDSRVAHKCRRLCIEETQASVKRDQRDCKRRDVFGCKEVIEVVGKHIWVTNSLLGNKGFRVTVDEMASVRRVKLEIEKIAGIPWRQQTLVFRDAFVLDNDCQVFKDLPLPWRLSVLVNRSFQYVVIRDKTDNTVFVMDVDLEANICSILDRICANRFEERRGGKFVRILLFKGKLLEPSKPISSYKICSGDELQLDRYNPEGYPRKVFIKSGGKYKKGVRVGPFYCDPLTSVYDLKVRFINSTGAPKGRYRLFSGQNELGDQYTASELDLQDGMTLRTEMPEDPLLTMRPKNTASGLNSRAEPSEEAP